MCIRHLPVCVCVCACVRACVRACMRACVCETDRHGQRHRDTEFVNACIDSTVIHFLFHFDLKSFHISDISH